MPTCSVLTTVLFLISDPNKRRQYDRKGFHGIQDYNVIISIFFTFILYNHFRCPLDSYSLFLRILNYSNSIVKLHLEFVH
ncbi:hypothetical protein BHE74_00010635 [Ensete ventricosum]|nr:hypothetical protein BHE74_00010635 [Ensete ventricosum]